MKLTDDQKTVLNLLKHYYDIAPSNEEIILFTHELAYHIEGHKVDLILKKFAKDYDIIQYVVDCLYNGKSCIKAKITFKKEFKSFYDNCEAERLREEQERIEEEARMDADYTAYMEQCAENKTETDAKEKDADDIKTYWLNYSEKSRKLILNDCLVIAKTNLNSAPDNFLSYIFKNPNREISLTEIGEKGKVEIKRDFHKILDDLYFRGAVKKLFFDVSKTTITFHNPISKKQMQEAGIELIQLSDFIRNNPKE